MNIIIPLGGKEQKFKDEDYKLPKIFVPVLGKEIIFWVIESLNLSSKDSITIIYNNELENFRLEDRIKRKFGDINFNFIKLPFQTYGPVETILYGLSKLSEEELKQQIIIHDGDSYVKSNVLEKINSNENKIFYTINNEPNPIYSYIKTDDCYDKIVTEIKEKEKISNKANIGCYVFKDALTFLKYSKNLKENSYISDVYDNMLKNEDEMILCEEIKNEDFVCFGTPKQIINFSVMNNNDVSSSKRFCFDLDNTLVTYPKINGDYTSVEPIEKNIKFLKYLKLRGHIIVIYTARRMLTHKGNLGKVMVDIGKITFETLEKFNIPYDEIYFGKPHADFYIDDLMVNSFFDLEKETGFYISNIQPRKFNNIEFKENTIVKTSEKDLSGEIHYYSNIPEKLKKYFPSLISKFGNYLEIERIKGNTLSKMYCQKTLSKEHIDMLFSALDEIHNTKYDETKNLFSFDIYRNYTSKLYDRYNSFDYSIFPKSSFVFSKIFSSLSVYENLDLGKESIIHGDFVFSNIILTKENNLKFIDMRGKLGENFTIKGDMFYDYGKIYQSLIGYDFILNDTTPSFSYINGIVKHFEKLFIEKFGEEQFFYLKYITASMLFSLIPLHNNKKCIDYYNLIEYLI